MKSTEVTVFDRKSGGAEGSAVRPGSRTKVSVPLVPPQNRHPERSASPIDLVTQRLWRAVEGPRRRVFYPMLLGAFRLPKPDKRNCCDTHLMENLAGPPGAGSVVEKLRAALGKIRAAEVL